MLENKDTGANMSKKFEAIYEYFAQIDLTKVKIDEIYVDLLERDATALFNNICALLISILYKTIQSLDDIQVDGSGHIEIKILISIFRRLRQRVHILLSKTFMISHGDNCNTLKLYLICLSEIECVSDVIFTKLEEAEKQKAEFVIPFCVINSIMDKFDNKTEEESLFEANYVHLGMLFSVRMYLLALLDRPFECAYWLTQLTKLSASCSDKYRETMELFKSCDQFAKFIPNLLFEETKFHASTSNWQKAIKTLEDNIEIIEESNKHICKHKAIYNKIKNIWLISDIRIYILEIASEKDSANFTLKDKFDAYLNDYPNRNTEKIYYLYSKFLNNYVSVLKQSDDSKQDKKQKIQELMISTILLYLRTIKAGHQYLWQTLPKILEIWFDFSTFNLSSNLFTKMSLELECLPADRIAQVLKILLSQFSNVRCRKSIVKMLGKVAAEYPLQSSWWLFHYEFFHKVEKVGQIKTGAKNDIKVRTGFVNDIIKEVQTIRNADSSPHGDSDEEILVLLNGTKSFMKALTEFAFTEAKKPQINISKELEMFDFDKCKVVMPTEENLRPRAPDNYGNNYYKKDPVLITKVLSDVIVMRSKEMPKKIGFVGSDNRVYYFLLKKDNEGDLRKEARFVDYANLLNTIFESSSDSRVNSLQLKTYSIVPLSRNTGLIEWVNRTMTIKNIICDEWEKYNIKADLGAVGTLVKTKYGGKLSDAWEYINQKVTKDVLWSFFSNRFPHPDKMMDARANFIQSYSAWSIINYIIGLGDRH